MRERWLSEPRRQQGGWHFYRLLRETLSHWRTGWCATPADARRRWIWTVVIGYAVVVAMMIALASAGAARIGNGPMVGEAAFDLRLLRELHVHFNAALWLQTPGTDIPLLIVLIATVGPLAWRGRALEALSVLAGYVLVYSVVNLGWMVWPRNRPTIIAAGIAAPGFHSFPSGHTAKSFAVYGILAFLWARSTVASSEQIAAFLLALLVSAFVGIGRLGMGAHWPSDVAGGALFGLLIMLVMIEALRRAEGASSSDGIGSVAEQGARSAQWPTVPGCLPSGRRDPA